MMGAFMELYGVSQFSLYAPRPIPLSEVGSRPRNTTSSCAPISDGLEGEYTTKECYEGHPFFVVSLPLR